MTLSTLKHIAASALLLGTINLYAIQNTTSAKNIEIKGIAQNPEGIEYDKNDHTFLLSSLNASAVIKVNTDGSYKPFTHGEKFPLSTAGLQIDYKRNRLLVAGFNGMEIMDKDPKTKGISYLRVYNLKTGKLEQEINLSSLVPNASAYFANDIAIDDEGNAYISDWYAQVIYKVNTKAKASIFWKNNTPIKSGPNGLDFRDGKLLVSLLSVNEKGLYDNYALLNIPTNNAKNATIISTPKNEYHGFDGMVIKENGHIIGVTNDGKNPGGNLLLELSTQDNWKSAQVIHSKDIQASTTVAITPENQNYVIHQDFSDNFSKNWKIENITF